MQDTFVSLGRGIDGVVGRMVDRFGEAGAGDRASTGDAVQLLRYFIVSTVAGRERVLHVDETLVTDGASGKALEDRLLAPYAAHVDRDHLEVHTRVLRRWQRRPAPVRPTRVADATPAPPAPGTEAPAPSATPRKTPLEKSPGRRGRAVAATEPAEHSVEDLDRRLIAALADSDATGLSMAQLVKRVGERSGRLRVRLQHLARAGTVRRAGDGLKTRYRLTDQQRNKEPR